MQQQSSEEKLEECIHTILLSEHKDMKSTEMVKHQQKFTQMMTVKKLLVQCGSQKLSDLLIAHQLFFFHPTVFTV